MHKRGGAVTVNFFDSTGKLVDQSLIEKEANKRMISLRIGCFCNPGAGETAGHIIRAELDNCFNSGKKQLTLNDYKQCIQNKSVGAVRISVGLVTNYSDVRRMVDLARFFLT
jgi:selenocysteine lyase/cysteine desulfurase